MQIAYIGFKNIMGVEDLAFAPGKINIIEGSNGQGKTSVLKAIQGAVGGGHDATLLRNGEEKAEVVIVFDDGLKLHKQIKNGKSDVKLTDSSGKEIKRAASFLKSAIDAIGVNPVQILTASTKERVQLLLNSIPMETPFDDIERITGLEISRDDKRHPMEIITETSKKFYDDRQDNNRSQKEKTLFVSKMRGTIPFREDATGWGEILEKLNSDKEALEYELRDNQDAGKVLLTNTLADLTAQREKEIEAARAKYDKAAAEADEKNRAANDKLFEGITPKLAALAEKIGEAKTSLEASGKIEAAKTFVKEGEVEIAELEKDSADMSKVIGALDVLKARLLKNLPVAGLEVKGGDIYLDDVAFDSVNKAKRVQFALAIAGLRESEIPIVCVDDLETLDAESFAIFKDEAEKTKMQFFVTRVTDDQPLTINGEPN